mgnify:CR=1 FL=1
MMEGGTLVVPGRGRLTDSADIAYYRDMMTIMRDRMRNAIKKGMTLAQIKAGKVKAETRTVIGRIGIGVGIKQGAPRPDISTPEAFKKALLSAKKVAYPEEGASGIYFANLVKKLGIETIFVDASDPQNFAKAITPNTKALYAETLGNPSLNVLDIEAIAAIGNQAGVPLLIDNTFASPYLCQPLKWGAAISLGAGLGTPSALNRVQFRSNNVLSPTLGRGYANQGLNGAISEFITNTNSTNTALFKKARAAALFYQLDKPGVTMTPDEIATAVAAIEALPEVGRMAPTRILMVVVFPAPLGPMKPRI